MKAQGKRGRPKQRWLDSVREIISERTGCHGVRGEGYDRATSVYRRTSTPHKSGTKGI